MDRKPKRDTKKPKYPIGIGQSGDCIIFETSGLAPPDVKFETGGMIPSPSEEIPYCCKDCPAMFEVIRLFQIDPILCPHCGSDNCEQIIEPVSQIIIDD
mgnify:CR=1 FL=1